MVFLLYYCKFIKKLFYPVIIAKLRFLAFCGFFWIAIWLNIEEVMSD